MQPRFYFLALITLTVAYAFLDFRGRWRSEQVVAVMFVVAYALTHLLNTQAAHRYQGLEHGTFAVDLGLLAGLVIVALRADRYWPLCMVALQMMSVCAHLAKTLHVQLLPGAYQESVVVWSYLLVALLPIATWRQRRRHKAAQRMRAIR